MKNALGIITAGVLAVTTAASIALGGLGLSAATASADDQLPVLQACEYLGAIYEAGDLLIDDAGSDGAMFMCDGLTGQLFEAAFLEPAAR